MIVRYVHPDDVPRYLDAGWQSLGIDPRYRSQVMAAPIGAAEPNRERKLTERYEDDL